MAWNSKNISKYAEDLQKLHERHHNEEIQVLSKKCFRFAKCLFWFLITTTLVVCLLSKLGFKNFELLVPAIYDVFATGPFYYVLMIINTVHMFAIIAALIVCDLFPSFCVARIVKNQAFAAHDFEHCTDSFDPKVNENSLNASMKYYAAIRR
jgi:predicted ferric reductase